MMFEGIKSVMRKAGSSKKDNKAELSLSPVLKADELLDNEKYQENLKEYPPLMGMTEQKYQDLCQVLINNFAEYVQELPETRGGYFSFKGGILEHGLKRTKIALNLLRSYFVTEDGAETEKLSDTQTLWAYAVFSAALLQGIGKIFVDISVTQFTKTEDRGKPWAPMHGSLPSVGATLYDYDFVANFPEPFRNRVSMILARQIMPDEGFDWIASDPDLFAIWLALLDDDSQSAKTLGPILFMAEDLAIKEYFDEVFAMVHHDENPDAKKDKKFAEMKDKAKRESKKVVKKFCKWVKDGIKSGKISLVDGPVRVVPGGVLITQNAMYIFAKENPNLKNWKAIQTAFSGMGITKKGPMNQIFQAYMKQHNKTIITGMVVKNHAMLIPKEAIKKAKPNEYVKIKQTPKQTPKVITPKGKLINSPIKSTAAKIGPNIGIRLGPMKK